MAKHSSWLEYIWDFEGEETYFGVELSLYKTAPDPEAALLVYFCFQTLDEHELTASDIRRAEEIIQRASRRANVSAGPTLMIAMPSSTICFRLAGD